MKEEQNGAIIGKMWHKIEEIEKLRSLDHDTLIRLETKVDSVLESVKEIKDGTAAQLANHEQRINDMEKLRDELNPKELVTQIKSNAQWIHDFKLTWKIILAISASIGGIVGFIVNLVLKLWEHTN